MHDVSHGRAPVGIYVDVLGIAIDFSSLTFHCIFLLCVRSVMPYYNKMMMVVVY